MSNWLPNDGVVRITKKKRFKAQKRRLSEMGIRFTEAYDGEPLVPVNFSDPAARGKQNRNVSNWELHR